METSRVEKVDKEECVSFLSIHFLRWGQDLDLVVGPCDKGWEKYMCSLCQN